MQCSIPNLKHLRQVVWKHKTFSYFPMCVYGSNLGDILDPGTVDRGLNKLGKGLLRNEIPNFKHLR